MRQPKRRFGSVSSVLSGLSISSVLFGLAALAACPAIAHAQSARPRAAHEDRDQHVVFDDDLLDADLATPFGDPIFSGHVRLGHVMLIRPRTSFVPELYESVENI